jgi:Mycoplasma protein of unknown function, DUF285
MTFYVALLVGSLYLCNQNTDFSFLLVKFSGGSSFNADLSRWNVSNVAFATSMFYGAALFNQSLCSWREILPSDVLLETIFTESGCSETSDPVLNGTAFCRSCITT